MKSKSLIFRLLLAIVILEIGLLFVGCAINPVTGREEIILIPQSMEIQMGKENYLPLRQMQGGDYVVDPEVVAYVNEVGNKLARVSDRKLPYEFVVVNSSEVNAWMLPGGKMAINRGLLLKLDSEAELAAVIGHEITHAAAKHSVKQMQKALLLQAASAAAAYALESSTDKEWLQAIGIIGVQAASILLQASFSRHDEREADHYGMVYMSRAGYNPQGAVRVQEMLLKESQGRHDNLFTRLLSTHPPSAERLKANRDFAAQLPQTGIVGREIYHRRLAHLFHDAPAYEFYDKANELFKKGNLNGSLALVNKAISLEPNEALFHILKGKLLQHLYQTSKALTEYRRAVQLNPDYYEGHLRLGLLWDALGNRYQAKEALENSLRLLKTAAALRRLGNYALLEGDIERAREYLREAAKNPGKEGRRALADLLKIELPRNARAYIKAELSRDNNGQLQFIIKNTTPFAVNNIVVEVSDNSGSKRIALRGIVQPNSESIFNMGVYVTQEQINNSAIVAISARLVEDY